MASVWHTELDAWVDRFVNVVGHLCRLLIHDLTGLLVHHLTGLLVHDLAGLLVHDLTGLLVHDLNRLLIHDLTGLLVVDHGLLEDWVHHSRLLINARGRGR